MIKYRFKSRNLGMLLAYRKAQKLRDVATWKSVFHNLSSIFFQHEEHGRRKRPAERIIWFIIRVIAVLSMLLMMLDFTMQYKKSPTITTPETRLYPIQDVDFPAIAICNVNRISRKAAIKLAQEIMENENIRIAVNLTVSDFTRLLSLLGQLYLYGFEYYNIEETELLHMILERWYNVDRTNIYDVDRIMKRLTPKCRYMLEKCSWNGKVVECDDIFVLSKTQDGYCCTFNQARRNGFENTQNDVFVPQYIERMTNIGAEYGLSVLLNPRLSDNFYKMLPINGFKVLIYDPLDYPDVPSGQVRQIVISPKTETYVDLDAIIFYTVEDVRSYDIQERDCLFQTEQSKIFHGYYSYSDCIVYCRVRDIFRLCSCMPFFYPNIGHARVCNLKDLSCLIKFKERWRNVKPRFENVMMPFDSSKVGGLYGYLSCDCLPSCTDITYSAQSSSIPLSLSKLSWGRGNSSIKDHSILHIFFGKIGAIRLRQDVLYYWYDLMSNYGGVCSFFLGISIIDVIEILYRLILRIWGPDKANSTCPQPAVAQIEEIKENQDIVKVATITIEPTKVSEVTQPLHWEELTGIFRKKQLKNSPNLLLNPSLKQ